MRIVLEVDSHDNGITTGTLWDLLDDLVASEQIKSYDIAPLESIVYSIEDAYDFLRKGYGVDVNKNLYRSEEQKKSFAEELNSRMYDAIEGDHRLWQRIRNTEKQIAYLLLNENRLFKK